MKKAIVCHCGRSAETPIFHHDQKPLGAGDALFPMPYSQCPMPYSQCLIPHALCPMPDARYPGVPNFSEKGTSSLY